MPDVYRITTLFQNGTYKLHSAHRVSKRIPPGCKVIDEGCVGTWVLVTSKKGDTLYARNIINPPGSDIEIHTGDPDAPLSRVPDKRPVQLFHILAPILPGAAELRLIQRSQKGRNKITSVDHLKFSFSELQKLADKPKKPSITDGRTGR